MDRLHDDGVGVVNSALFHGGFLTGGNKFDYRDVDPGSDEGILLYGWRDAFLAVCEKHRVNPGDACIHFGLSHPAIVSIALNTSKPEKMDRNVEILLRKIPDGFWKTLKEKRIIDPDYSYIKNNML
jgi:D-threo-aldose 1-dehydrogenase